MILHERHSVVMPCLQLIPMNHSMGGIGVNAHMLA